MLIAISFSRSLGTFFFRSHIFYQFANSRCCDDPHVFKRSKFVLSLITCAHVVNTHTHTHVLVFYFKFDSFKYFTSLSCSCEQIHRFSHDKYNRFVSHDMRMCLLFRIFVFCVSLCMCVYCSHAVKFTLTKITFACFWLVYISCIFFFFIFSLLWISFRSILSVSLSTSRALIANWAHFSRYRKRFRAVTHSTISTVKNFFVAFH